METLRPNAQRARTAINLIWIMLAIEAFGFTSSAFLSWIYISLDNGEYVSDELQFAGTFLQGSYGILLLAGYTFSIITFIRWFRRAYYNIAIKTGATSYSEGWAAGAWFVPIMNLYVPYRIMKELYEKTDQYLILEANEPYTNRLETKNIVTWWTLWIIYSFLSNIVARVTWQAEELPQLINSEILSMVTFGLFVPLCVVTANVIKTYSQAEDLLYEASAS